MNDVSAGSGSPSAPRRSPGAERARRTRRRLGIVAAIVAAVGALYAAVQAWLHFNDYQERADDSILHSAIAYTVIAVLFAVAAAIVWRGQMWQLITTSAACGVSFVLVLIFAVRQGESALYLAPWLILTPAVLMLAWLPWFFLTTNEP